jgi:hypothetical protein
MKTISEDTENINNIIEVIGDYNGGGLIDFQHVEKWGSQFEDQDRGIILSEIANILKKFYISQQEAMDFLNKIIHNQNIIGGNFVDRYKRVKFLNIQRKGSSQEDLLVLMGDNIEKEFSIELDECGVDPDVYIYVDDCLFSGSTVKWDINNWKENFKEGTQLHLVFLGIHLRNFNYIKQEIRSILSKKKVKVEFWNIIDIKDTFYYGKPHKYECLWVPDVEFSENSIDFLKKLNESRSEKQREAIPLLRSDTYPIKETLFTSKKNREIVERAFFEKGVYLKSLSSTSNEKMYPMGFDNNKTTGFGSVFITYRNIANNCPLVLWWGDSSMPKSHPFSKWHPLFPRTVNE